MPIAAEGLIYMMSDVLHYIFVETVRYGLMKGRESVRGIQFRGTNGDEGSQLHLTFDLSHGPPSDSGDPV